MKNRNIVVCLDIYKTAGGIQRFNRLLIRALEMIGDKKESFFVLSLMDNANNLNSYTGPKPKLLKFSNGNKFIFLWHLFILALTRQPECIFLCHLHLTPVALFLRIISPFTKIFVFLYGFEAWEKISPLQLFGIKACYRIISISSYTKEVFCRSNSIPLPRVEILPLALDPLWSLDLVAITIIQPVKMLWPYILCVSRLIRENSHYKGVDQLIKALGILQEKYNRKDLGLVIVGEGDDIDRLLGIGNEYQVTERLIFTGRLTDEQLYSYYQGCEIFALPSKKEGFGLVFLEAMAFRKPIIASNEGASGEVVEDELTGYLVSHEHPEEIAARVHHLLSFPEVKTQMGAEGFKRLKKYYTFETFSERLKTFIQRN